MIGNPIIAKELIQAAHRRRTYLIRAGLPTLVAVVLGFQLWDVLPRYGQDWRAIALVTRGLFSTSVWLEFIAFSFLGFVGATAAVHQEWANRTMEVLCATPLSRLRILHGKYVAVLSQVLMMALALLPITAVLYYVGRLPPEMALGSFAVIVGSVLFFSSLGLLQAVTMRPREGSTPVSFFIVGPLLLAIIFLDCFVFVRHPVLDALIPPWALYLVLSARPTTGWSVAGFATLSFGLLAGVSVAALLLAPGAFRLTLARAVSGEVRAGRGARLRRFLRGRRPRMKPREDPFVWQEKGGSTRFIRWALWLVYAVLVLFFVGYGIYYNDLSVLQGADFYWVLFYTGLVTVIIFAASYGATVFAREKSRRTAEALLLTGHSPARYYWAKVRGLYWALRFSLLAVAGLLVLVWWYSEPYFGRYNSQDAWSYLGLLELLLVGPAVAAVVGMAFSALARSPQRAVGAIVTGGVLAFVLGSILTAVYEAMIQGSWEPDAWFLPLTILTAVFFVLNRTWTPVRLSALLALSILLLSSGEFAVGKAVEAQHTYGAEWYTAFILGTNVVVGGLACLWLVVGLRTFDAGLAGAPAHLLSRRRSLSRGAAARFQEPPAASGKALEGPRPHSGG